MGRNPKSGERVLVPEKRVPHFKAGKELRERVDRSPGPSHHGQTVHHGNGSHGDHAAQVSAPAGTLHEDGQLNLVRS
ncbi:Integration host factor subunit beta [compost metagenome]